ncbi:olfactory receptor 6F1-like [Leptodactylus fuscus]|uniref:olfactory receptor 6F1-like n=1 Tax=Leptodactylus fuscus TaxID=238119 RepID=UPI003F4ED0BB
MYCGISKIMILQILGCRAIVRHDNDPKNTSKTALLKKLRVEENKVYNIHQLPDVFMEEWKRIPVAAHDALENSMPKKENLTLVSEFFLSGFQGSQCLRLFLFCVFLVVYCGTICGNLLIITLVSTRKNLQTPMYFFISQLSISDILLTTDVVPNMLHVLLNNGAAITFTDCMAQFYFFCTSEVFECFLLTVMSYDRYLAICSPLHYNSLMTSAYSMKLAVICWLLGFSASLTDTLLIQMLEFCGTNIVDHFFCDLDPLLKIACSDTYIVQLDVSLLGIPAVIVPTILIITTYGKIISVILRIPSSTGRQKAFSTCSSHLIVVCIFYWTLFGVYVLPTKGQSSTISKLLSLLYTMFTPLINPIIYSLRNKDIRKGVQSYVATVHKPMCLHGNSRYQKEDSSKDDAQKGHKPFPEDKQTKDLDYWNHVLCLLRPR